MIQATDLKLSFGRNKVLDGLTLDVREGETLVIVGRSGIGKSVLLRCMTALVRPEAGQVIIDGEDIHRLSNDKLLLIRRKIGMLLQEGALFDSMTVYENVAFPLVYHKMFPRKEIDRKVHRFLEVVEMDEHLEAYPQELSGGMKRKVALARAMIIEPKYLFYDEPTSGLDPESSGIVETLIDKLKRDLGMTSLIVTHDIDLARYLGDRIALLDDGRIIQMMGKDVAFLPDSPIFEHFVKKRERMHNAHGN